MKTFEERWTAWVDGQLSGEELAEFEKELAQRHKDAALEREGALKLGAFLREHGSAPPLTNEDFFNNQLMERVYTELPTRPAAAGEKEQGTWWGLPRMVWAGAACLVAAMLILPLLAPRESRENGVAKEVAPEGTPLEEDTYFAEVLESHTGNPQVSVTAFHSEENDLTVVWLDGLDYLPANSEITPYSRAN